MYWRFRVLTFYTIIAVISVSFFTFLCIPVFILKPKFSIRYKISIYFARIFIILMKYICSIEYEIEGAEKLPQNTPYVALPNHQSFWDNLFFPFLIPNSVFVIKRELFDIPVFGWGLAMVEPIAVDRSNIMSVKQIIIEGEKKIQQGISLVIFPEGTRVKPGNFLKLKPSAAKLALHCSVPIVIIVHNAGLFWPKGFWFEKPGVIKVKVLEVLDNTRIREFEDARSLTNYVETVMNREKELLLKSD